ncbi:Rieske (2Fe-2S) protein [Nocardioides sp.]|uniref:Rieske (2Fe-2S) protein n=1 Tax=Nocardioides sp. TaxID=35761 RepID=UPI001A360BDF|nr:Rieske (2Fe-2S) protein [Nocardioides sp.]MBJ7357024.1 Rieske (2Fe-2S) protein [Nocardioides sp.]
MTQVSRRTVTGLATAGLSLPLLAACGDDSDTASDPGTGSGSSSGGGSTPSQAESSSGGGGGSDALASTSDIEVGGGTIFADEQVVVTQPSEGEFKAFNTTCTHQGCPVQSVSDGTINCDCHGSKFSISDGSPESGPATSPLEEVGITVEGDSIVLA